MEATNKDGIWIVNSDSGHTYHTTLDSCDCPHFIHRIKKSGGNCKHMVFINGLISKNENYEEIIGFIRQKTNVKFDVLCKEFGTEVFDKLLFLEKKGEIIYNRRKNTYNILE
jgi:predicted nucleic acid-binding Zn finger protein